MPQQITIRIDLEDQFLYDVMTTMVESAGHALWYWDDGDPDYFRNVKVERDDDLSVTSITFDIRDHGDKGKGYVIDKVSVAKAIETILSTYPLRADLMEYLQRGVSEGDAGDIDAEVADCIAQWVCFGELVYS